MTVIESECKVWAFTYTNHNNTKLTYRHQFKANSYSTTLLSTTFPISIKSLISTTFCNYFFPLSFDKNLVHYRPHSYNTFPFTPPALLYVFVIHEERDRICLKLTWQGCVIFSNMGTHFWSKPLFVCTRRWNVWQLSGLCRSFTFETKLLTTQTQSPYNVLIKKTTKWLSLWNIVWYDKLQSSLTAYTGTRGKISPFRHWYKTYGALFIAK